MKKNSLLSLFLCFCFAAQSQTPDTAAARVEIDSLINLNNNLVKEQKLDEALILVEEAEKKCLKTFGEQTALYATITKSFGTIHYYKGEYSETEHFWLKSKKILEITIGKKHPDYAAIINNVGILYYSLGDFEKAEPLFLEAMLLREKSFGKEHPNYAASLNNLSALYHNMGNFEKVEPLQMEALRILEKVVGKEHPDYAASLNNLGLLHVNMGRFEKAEPLFLEALQIREKALGKEHPDYAVSLINLGVMFDNMGNFEKVEKLYLEALRIEEKTLGKEHPDYAASLNRLGSLYYNMGLFQKTEPLFLEALRIREKTISKEHPDYIGTLVNLGNLNTSIEQYKKAEGFYLSAKKVFEVNEKLKEHPYYTICLSSLGDLYCNRRKFGKAELLYLEALRTREKTLGKKHPDYAASLNSLGSLYYNMELFEKAEPFFSEATECSKSILQKATKHLSEKDLSKFTNTFKNKQNQLLSFTCLSDRMAGSVYNNSLFYKGFLLSATQRVNQLAQTDSASHELFLELKAYNRRLSTAYSKPIAERDSISIAELEEKANTIEKELTRSVAGFGEALQQVSWQEVQTVLKSGDAAIEFVHYNYYNPDKTDSIMYAALLLLPEDEPQYISLFEEREINALLATHQERRSDYVNNLYAIDDRGSTVLGKPKKTLYDLIWKPLASHLEGVDKVYFSPSGLLHRINLAAIPTSDEKALCDQYDLVQVNSTRQLVIPDKKTSIASSSLLMGGIQYELDSLFIMPNLADSLEKEVLVTRGAFEFENPDSTLRGVTWNYLKYTEKEVHKIGELLSSNGYQTDVQTGAYATEELFRKNGQGKSSPHILHLATHGFFFPDPKSFQTAVERDEPVFKTSDHPMIRSGLILAGGNHVWQGKPSIQGIEDGVLTAYEISQMDLSNTELVVLSACETGLGDINGNEGVYGLQRAFKIAGAKYLIMSLWQIPDRETKDFMVSFYEHLLEDKMTIPDAFRKTQKEKKERFYNPYQWAGFVLVE